MKKRDRVGHGWLTCSQVEIGLLASSQRACIHTQDTFVLNVGGKVNFPPTTLFPYGSSSSKEPVTGFLQQKLLRVARSEVLR